ncbi:hypothetical protein [Sphingomonas sp.]|jgi:hypothetical protein|uniref:hypothetical protein n=1 Tax=Sphingomonas sp. TaxID=28214 RepID=UPI002E14A781|nr:hypothetical protein [Sphingomonas sp.]
MDEAPLIFRAVQSAFGLYGALYVATAIFAPGWFLDTLAVNHMDRRSAIKQRRRNILTPSAAWYSMPAVFVTWIAVGVLVYAAVYAIVAVLPYDWGSRDEDGEWQSLRWSIQYGAGFIGGIALCMRLEANAEVLVWGPAERKARQAVSKALRCARGATPEVKESVLLGVDKDLQPEPHQPPSYENDYISDLYCRVQSDIRG